MSFAESSGRNLARHRRTAGISQELLAELASLHRTAVGQIERGERVARADTLLKLAVALKIDPGRLFEGIVWKPPTIGIGAFEFPSPPTAAETPDAHLPS